MNEKAPKKENRGGGSLGARIWKVGLGLSLAGAGAVTAVYLWMVYEKAVGMEAWVSRPAIIAESGAEVGHRDRFGLPRYRLKISYRYDFEGQTYLSNGVKRLPVVTKTREGLREWLERFPEGVETICYVNPDDPGRALLVRDSKAALFSIWFPGIFILGGLGIAVSALRGGGP
jgi:hypothetical protein